jgi:protoporphyrinogen oxidase
MTDTIILGAGVTGLAAGIATGCPVYEAALNPGGICSSYYQQGYRFERGGGHWIFGVDATMMEFMSRFAEMQPHERRSSVYFADTGEFVPFPIQNNLPAQPEDIEVATMKDWFTAQFGESLCQRFFHPFNERYTAGLYGRIAPQDQYKTPTDRGNGYNLTFVYPPAGLDAFVETMAAKCDVRYGREVGWINTEEKRVEFTDGESVSYSKLLSTLPLNVVQSMAKGKINGTNPYVSIHVVNIGAERGPKCPSDHWLYIPDAMSGFHRVGFYSNVDESFSPAPDRVGVYVEMTSGPDTDQIIAELQSWGFIGKVDAVDTTFIPCAYTYRWPGSTWRKDTLAALADKDIYQVGRYARWQFQGIAESIREGLSCLSR